MEINNIRIKNHSLTLQEWSNKNPVLKSGELCWVSDYPGLFKVGVEGKKWNEISFPDAFNQGTSINGKYLPLTGGTVNGNTTFYGNFIIGNTNNRTDSGSDFLYRNDGSLKIYTIARESHGPECVCLQTSFDGQDPETSNYPTQYPSRALLSLQPRGGRVVVGGANPSTVFNVKGTITVDHYNDRTLQAFINLNSSKGTGTVTSDWNAGRAIDLSFGNNSHAYYLGLHTDGRPIFRLDSTINTLYHTGNISSVTNKYVLKSGDTLTGSLTTNSTIIMTGTDSTKSYVFRDDNGGFKIGLRWISSSSTIHNLFIGSDGNFKVSKGNSTYNLYHEGNLSLAAVAKTGNYNDLTNKPTYSLSSLGGIGTINTSSSSPLSLSASKSGTTVTISGNVALANGSSAGTIKTGGDIKSISSGVVTVESVEGFSLSKDGDTKVFGTIPTISSSGVMEVGRYLDFHYNNTSSYDNSIRLMCPNVANIDINLPSTGGTLALTSGVVNNLALSTSSSSLQWTKGTSVNSISAADLLVTAFVLKTDTSGKKFAYLTLKDKFQNYSTESPVQVINIGSGGRGFDIVFDTESYQYVNAATLRLKARFIDNDPTKWRSSNNPEILNVKSGIQGINTIITVQQNVTMNANLTANHVYKSSDIRLKENIKVIDPDKYKGLASLDLKEFDYKKNKKHSIGYIAQEVEKIAPEVVNTDDEGYKHIEYTELLLLKVRSLECRLLELENKLKEKCQN